MKINSLRVLFLSFLIAGVLGLFKSTTAFVFQNLGIQLTIFLITSIIPAYFTHKLSYVDCSWPYGLLAIGIQMFFHSTSPVGSFFAVFYCWMGGRMALMITLILIFNNFQLKEFNRYEFQRMKWKKRGLKNELVPIMLGILVQCAANIGTLFIPAALLSCSPNLTFNPFTIFAIVLWISGFLLESTADFQKRMHYKKVAAAGSQDKNTDIMTKTFRSGLWQYCRHPNYFYHWIQWNAYCVACIPAILPFVAANVTVAADAGVAAGCVRALSVVFLVGGLLLASWVMYTTFTLWTGAPPAEYFSLKKRPDYQKYIDEVPMFFPNFTLSEEQKLKN